MAVPRDDRAVDETRARLSAALEHREPVGDLGGRPPEVMLLMKGKEQDVQCVTSLNAVLPDAATDPGGDLLRFVGPLVSAIDATAIAVIASPTAAPHES